MSYTMTHLVIADQYVRSHGIAREEAALLLIASISPDSVHKNKDFTLDMKEHSHFMPEKIKWGHIYLDQQMEDWYVAIRENYLFRNRNNLNSLERAFLVGYGIHLLVDVFNCKYFYAPNLCKFGLDVVEFRKEYREQCLNFDHALYRDYKYTEDIFQKLEQGLNLLRSHLVLESLNLDKEINCDSIGRMIELAKMEYEKSSRMVQLNAHMITQEGSMRFIEEMGVHCNELFTMNKENSLPVSFFTIQESWTMVK